MIGIMTSTHRSLSSEARLRPQVSDSRLRGNERGRCSSSAFAAPALAASGKQPPPPGSFDGAPAQYTRFSSRRTHARISWRSPSAPTCASARAPRGIRRFNHPIRARRDPPAAASIAPPR